MRFIDHIDVDITNLTAKASYVVAAEAEFLDDHFPNAPMLPGIVMLEIAVQAAASLIQEKLGGRALFDLDFLECLHVTRRVTPNETLKVSVRIAEAVDDDEVIKCEAKATVAGETTMRAKFDLAKVLSKPNRQHGDLVLNGETQ